MGDSPLRSALLKSELFRSRVDTTKEVVSRDSASGIFGGQTVVDKVMRHWYLD